MVDMVIELYGGPADGIVLSVPDNTASWWVPTPYMTQAQFIALESGYPAPESATSVVEHLYIRSVRVGRRTKARVFTYSGAKRR